MCPSLSLSLFLSFFVCLFVSLFDCLFFRSCRLICMIEDGIEDRNMVEERCCCCFLCVHCFFVSPLVDMIVFVIDAFV